MQLTLTGNRAWNSDFCAPDGRLLYRVRMSNRKASLFKATSSGQLANLAEIEFHAVRPTKITVPGKGVTNSTVFFRKGRLGWKGRDRIFTGPSGLEYRWKLHKKFSELYTNDIAKAFVARYHPRTSHFLQASTPAYLEVSEGGLEMLDLIIITFVYIEKIREEKGAREGGEEAGDFGDGGGGGGGGGT
ncbi:hypothetical protein CC1G_04881 [Coprinopsis cinerea okayama7|uniref:DUF6593 domain-containing protein n=1 Tax=Coprinopsis cinerea (strain Okayama-7 / 130 / ATCC MYA-4618 / FGSC 9003) TaxID=240176 RepID=A8PFX2_COPC7|nr:hypothetical protein CC1G_04881 [Coprinopsis cinerea okayama7\|eukprot:XP_001841037.2 hypothetical protein CC1G_04881 [Coprinopsis cinerea okayama7\